MSAIHCNVLSIQVQLHRKDTKRRQDYTGTGYLLLLQVYFIHHKENKCEIYIKQNSLLELSSVKERSTFQCITSIGPKRREEYA